MVLYQRHLDMGRSSGPCLQQIKDMYPVNGTLLLYYLSDDPTDEVLENRLSQVECISVAVFAWCSFDP